MRVKEARIRTTGTTTSGTVVDNQLESSGENGMVFHAVVEFTNTAGERLRIISPKHSRRSHVAGTTLPVIYDPAAPAQAIVGRGSGTQLVVTGVVFTAFGVGAVVLVAFALSMMAWMPSPP
jgi:hypothetical protein